MLSKFVNHSHTCPVCGEKLSMYMQIIESTLFKLKSIDKNNYRFHQFMDKDHSFDDEYIDIDINKNKITCSSNKLKELCDRSEIYFYCMCNEEGYSRKPGYGLEGYELNFYYSCYYRSTENYNVVDGKLIVQNNFDLPILWTSFRVSDTSSIEGMEKVYMFAVDYKEKKTILWHYCCTEEQAKDKDFIPKIFEKEYPMLNKIPDLSIDKRDKLFNKLSSWVNLS